jgi:glycosyltransferase involved in cell wall biosynthesis
LKVLHVSTDFPSKVDGKLHNYGGLGMCLFQLVDGLTQRGVDLDILTRKDDGNCTEIIPGTIRVPYIKLTKSRNWKLTHGITLIPRLLLSLVNNKYDILHAHNPPAAMFSIPIAKIFGIKTVMTMHGPWAGVRDRFRDLAKLIEYCCLLNADVVTFDSHALKNMYPQDKKYIAIQNAVDSDEFKPMDKSECRSNLGLTKDRMILLYSGRAVYGKRLDTIFNVAKRCCDVDFIITGVNYDGRDGICPNIIYKKSIPNNEMPQLYSACDGLILASDMEGMSRAVLEAMSCGIGVIVSDIKANKETVGDISAGRFFKTDDELFEIVRDVTNEELSDMGKKGRKLVLSNYSVKRRIDAFIDVYDSLTETKAIYSRIP